MDYVYEYSVCIVMLIDVLEQLLPLTVFLSSKRPVPT